MKRESGFTLVELLVTLSVAGILASIAIPSFKTTIQNGRLTTATDDLLGALLYARSQAVTTAGSQKDSSGAAINITVCASSDGATCNSTNWANGWIVTGGTGGATGAAGTVTVLRVYPKLNSEITLDSAAYGGSVVFDKSGVLVTTLTATSGSGASYFILCDSRGPTYARAVYLGAGGQAKGSGAVGQFLNGTPVSSCSQ